ncbi:hypothetical protein [Paenibacillus sedimenti]|uniref:Uncharacterized protein n=1 Tax=Paenibacillus sedimenti TaxID=2770274 RepID=A0A926KXZ8_9BACL|nr:hypothetical protein [Paenibacillus sedimenti]MBD0384020.1 hypothetical protein [Paenibacillus sedimenti]
MSEENLQSPIMKQAIEQKHTIEQNELELTSEAVMANKQMDQEFYGEEQEDFSSESNTAWINRNQS